MLSSGHSPLPERAVFVSSNGAKAASYGPDANKDNSALPEPLAWNMMLPSLFKFGYFCHVDDGELETLLYQRDTNRNVVFPVPEELMDPVIWSLQMFHRVLTECSDEQLYDAGHYLRHQQAESAGRFMVRVLSLIEAYMRDETDMPVSAYEYPHETL